jgi:hypothetical protein
MEMVAEDGVHWRVVVAMFQLKVLLLNACVRMQVYASFRTVTIL